MARRGAKLGTSVLDLDIDDSKFHSKMSGAFKAANDFTAQTGKSLTQAGRAMSSVGSSMTRNVTLPILAAGGAVGKLGFDFDTTMSQIVALTSVSQDQIAGFREEILKLGPEVGKGPQELGEAFYFVASAGFEGAEAMEILRHTAKAAAAGLGDTSTVAKVIGSAVNAYGLEAKDAAGLTDTLVAAIGEGSAEAPEFAGALGNVIGSAAQIGATFNDVTAAIAAMTNRGIGAEEAVTSLNQVFTSLFKPTAGAAEALEGMGLSAAGLRQMIAEQGLLPTLQLLNDKFAGNAEATAEVFGNVRALRGVLALTGGDVEKTTDLFGRMQDTVGATGEAFSTVAESDSFKLRQAMAELEATGIQLGADVLPMVVEVLGEVAKAAQGLSKWWGELDDDTKQLILRGLAFIAMVGPLLIVVGKLTTGIGQLVTAVAFLAGPKGFPKAARAMLAFTRFMIGPAGIVAVVGAAVIAIDHLVDDALSPLSDEMKALADSTGEDSIKVEKHIGRLADNLGISFEAAERAVREYMEATGRSFDDAVRAVENGSKAMTDAQWDAVEQSGLAWEEYQRQIRGGAADGVDGAVEETEALAPEVVAALEAAGIAIDPAAEGALDGVDKAAAEAREAAINHMRAMLDGIANMFETDDTLADAWKVLIDRMDDPYTEAERKADIFSKNTVNNIRDALKTGDPLIVQDTQALVNHALQQIELMEPGALATGEAVPPAIRDGMDAQMSALITYLETERNIILGELTLDEAEELGLDGIWKYQQGMKRNEYRAFLQAANTARGVNQRLDFDASAGGASVVASWLAGMTSYYWANRRRTIDALAADAGYRFGRSLPTKGPLAGGVGSGGMSIGESWVTGIVTALGQGMHAITSSVDSVGQALTVDPADFTPHLPGARGVTGATGTATEGLGSTVTTIEYHLHYGGVTQVFERPDDFLDELQSIARFHDGAAG